MRLLIWLAIALVSRLRGKLKWLGFLLFLLLLLLLVAPLLVG